jgi:HK97 family phage prohead protease
MKLETRAFAADLQLRGEDQRTLFGVAVPWGQEARIGPRLVEWFTRGAFRTTNPAEVALTVTHPRDGGQLPIGRTDELADRDDGLHGAWYVPDTMAGNEVLELVRNRVALMLSIGFIPLPGGDHWTANRTRVERRAALLDHVAVVRAGAYPGARVLGLRSIDQPATPLLDLARLRRYE